MNPRGAPVGLLPEPPDLPSLSQRLDPEQQGRDLVPTGERWLTNPRSARLSVRGAAPPNCPRVRVALSCCPGADAVSRVLKRVLLIFVLSAGCGRNPSAPDSALTSPAWLTTVIRQLETQPVANPPAFVARYEYKGDTVYFVPQRCCDVMSVVYRSDGAVMCQADGGFAGTGDGRCPDFFAERRNERIIWRDPRS
jgi:hypothetical protein